MPPRGKSTEGAAAAAEPPRRSGRIASQPVVEAPAPKPARKASAASGSSSKKRPAEEPAEDKEVGDASTKKAKADEAAPDVTMAAPEEEEAAPAAAASTKLSPIDIGDSLPELVLKNEKGEDIQVGDLTKEKGVILFLVPKADTAGCTTQACAFRDSYPDFTGLNYDVYCLSADSSNAQAKWQTKKELPYPLISDPKRTLIAALGASEGGKTKRSHFIFEKGGKLIDKKMPVKPAESPQLALEFIKGLQSTEEGTS